MQKTILILAGAPGTGKTHFAEFIKSLHPKTVICSADDYMMEGDNYVFSPSKLNYCHNQCFEKFQKAMEAGEKVIIISNTNCRAQDRQRYINAVKEGYEVILLGIGDLGHKNQHNVPEEKVWQMAKTLKENFPF